MRKRLALSLTAVVLWFAGFVEVATGSQVSSRMNGFNQRKTFSQTAQQSAHTCQQAINIFKKGPASYGSILGSGVAYQDPDFTPSASSLFWADYPRQSPYSLQSVASASSWFRPTAKYSGVSLFGTSGIGSFDINQGYINDCFVLAPAQAMAMRNQRIDNIFINTAYPREGLIAMNLYVKGKPAVITVDDFLPFYYGSYPTFAKRSSDGDFWAAFIEKGFAKMMGSYEQIGGGWQAETWRILNGAPTRFYTMASISSNANTAWNLISDALSQDFLVGADTASTPPYGLVSGHAHTVVGAYTLTDSAGNVQQRLLRIRNPWGSDSYTGPWNDADTRWTTSYRSQVPFVNSNDGYFYIDIASFVYAFSYFQVNYIHDDYVTSYYERRGDDGAAKSYSFSLPRQQEVFVGLDFYNPRMYASGCRAGQQTTGSFSLLRGATVLDRYSFNDQLGFGWTQYANLAAGTYTLLVDANWTPYDVRDYVVSIYAADAVSIVDSNGQTSVDRVVSLTDQLKADLVSAQNNLSPYKLTDGSWYETRAGYFDAPSNNKYFFQFSGPTGLYNLYATVTLTSFQSTAVVSSSQAAALSTTVNADGSTTHTHKCQVLPKSGINNCSYLVYVPNSANGVKWSWTLTSWTNA